MSNFISVAGSHHIINLDQVTYITEHEETDKERYMVTINFTTDDRDSNQILLVDEPAKRFMLALERQTAVW